jgi:hypothetical protein
MRRRTTTLAGLLGLAAILLTGQTAALAPI